MCGFRPNPHSKKKKKERKRKKKPNSLLYPVIPYLIFSKLNYLKKIITNVRINSLWPYTSCSFIWGRRHVCLNLMLIFRKVAADLKQLFASYERSIVFPKPVNQCMVISLFFLSFFLRQIIAESSKKWFQTKELKEECGWGWKQRLWICRLFWMEEYYPYSIVGVSRLLGRV